MNWGECRVYGRFRNYSCKLLVLGLFLICSAVVGILIQGLHPEKAHATSDVIMTNEAPMLGSATNSSNANVRAYFIVGTGAVTDNKYAYAKIYLPVNPATGKNYAATVTMTWGAGVCSGGISFPLDTANSGAPNVDYNLQDMSDTESLTSGNFVGYFATANNLAGAPACGNKVISVPADSALASTITGHSNYAVLYFEAVINNVASVNSAKVFWITTVSSTGNAYSTISRPVKDYGIGGNVAHDQNYFGITMNPGQSVGISYGVQVSPRCGEYPTSTAVPSNAINMYDADSASNPSLQYSVQYIRKDNPGVAWTGTLVTVAAAGLGGNNVVNPTSMSFNAYNNERYKLNYNNLSSNNNIQTKVPFDQFDASNICYNSKCTAVNPTPTVRPGVPINIDMQALNTGTADWDINQKLMNVSTFTTTDMSQPPTVLPVSPGQIAHYKFTITNNTLGIYTVSYALVQNASLNSTFGYGANGNPACSLTYTIADVPVGTINATCKRLNGYIWFPTNLSTLTTGQFQIIDYTDGSFWTSPAFGPDGFPYNAAVADPTKTPPPGGHWFSFDMFRNGTNTPSPGDYSFGGPTGYNGGFASKDLAAFHSYHITLLGLNKAGTAYVPLTLPGGGEAAADLTPCMTFSCNVTFNPSSPAVGSAFNYVTSASIINNAADTFTSNGRTNNFYTINLDWTNISNPTYPSWGFSNNYLQYVLPAAPGTNNNGSAPYVSSFNGTVSALPATVTVTIGFGSGSDYYKILPCSKQVASYTKPYFKVFNSDVSAGGGFNSGQGSNNCSVADPNYYSSSAIKAFANSDNSSTPSSVYGAVVQRRMGSSVEFAAFALGAISGNTANNLGFYSGPQFSSSGSLTHGAQTPPYASNFTNPLTFGNTSNETSANSWGGKFGNVHCIPDWYGVYSDGLNINTSAPHAITYDLNNSADNLPGNNNRIGIWGDTGVKILDGLHVADIPNSNTVIKNRRTVVVLGDAYIQTNIISDPNWHWSSAAPNPPQLAIIVKGDIFIDPSVTRLDGILVAQYRQAAPAQTGIIATCGFPFRDATAVEVTTVCNQQLTISGSLIASQVKLLRSFGSLSAATAATDPRFAPPQPIGEWYGNTPYTAEIINYTPQLKMGAPFFDDDNSGSSSSFTIDSVLNLPPVL